MEISNSSRYYDFFDKHSANGRVLDQDLSSERNEPHQRTPKEMAARTEWNRHFDTIREHYFNERPDAPVAPRVCHWDILLEQRLMPPRLVLEGISATSQTSEPTQRCYPREISSWDGFAEEVQSFRPMIHDATLEKPYEFNIFQNSLIIGDVAKSDEEDEQSYLFQCLSMSLVASKMVHKILKRAAGVRLGKPNFVLMAPRLPNSDATENHALAADGMKKPSVICECQSTHNLALPMEAASVVNEYNASGPFIFEGNIDRSSGFDNVCHPLAQLVQLLVDNQCRYGALTSGTRTYFISLVGSGETLSVRVSDAWFVGQEHYLRAWLYVYSQGCLDLGLMETPAAWKKTSFKQQATKGDSNSVQDAKVEKTDDSTVSNKRARVGGEEWIPSFDDVGVSATSAILKSIPFIPFEDSRPAGTINWWLSNSSTLRRTVRNRLRKRLLHMQY
jgi:hypothetical protein